MVDQLWNDTNSVILADEAQGTNATFWGFLGVVEMVTKQFV